VDADQLKRVSSRAQDALEVGVGEGAVPVEPVPDGDSVGEPRVERAVDSHTSSASADRTSSGNATCSPVAASSCSTPARTPATASRGTVLHLAEDDPALGGEDPVRAVGVLAGAERPGCDGAVLAAAPTYRGEGQAFR
jgi:hypothetical protein